MKQSLEDHKHRPPQSHPRAKKLKLQAVYTAVLVIPFVVQIVTAVGLISWLSLRSGRQAVNQVTTDLSDEIIHRVDDQLQNYLEVPHIINQINVGAVSQDAVDLSDTHALELRFWRQIQLYDSLSSIGFGSVDGRYVAGDRRGNTFRLGHRDKDSPQGKLHMYETDGAGNPVKLVYTGRPNYDPRQRPWYRLGQQSPEGRWTEIFTYSSQPIFVISAVQALRDATGEFQGVVLSDLMLSDINTFLRGLEVGKTGATFIVERSGELIATSTQDPPYRIVDGKPQRLAATAAQSPLVQAAAQHLLSDLGGFDQVKTIQQLDFELDDQRVFLQVMPYIDPRGLDWLIVVALPEADFTGPVYANSRSIIQLGLLVMGVAIAVGLITARWLVRPIAGLAAAVTALANDEWDGTVPVERDDEIGLLANTFNRIAGQLRASLDALSIREANLAEAQKVARLGSWEYSLTEGRLTCSDELLRLYGLDAGDDSCDALKDYRLVHPEDRAALQATLEQALVTGQEYEIEHRILCADGQVRHVQSKGRALVDESGQVVGLFGTLMDITERVAADAERRHLLEREQAARQEAEAANQSKDQFLAILSHELRNPLNPILGWTRLLKTNRLPPEKTAQALDTIERNANLQVQLIEDILDVSRILRGKLKLTLCPLNLVDVVAAATETVQLSAQAKSITLTTRTTDAALYVEGDPNRLQQIITNLLTNAIKFTPEGGQVTVTLEQVRDEVRGEERAVRSRANGHGKAEDSRQQDEEEGSTLPLEAGPAANASPLAPHASPLTPHPLPPYAQVTVHDTGKGIDPEFLPHIFEHFRQADSTTTREASGLGLGLAIVRNLTEMHGGTIAAASEGANRGATFTLRLPLTGTTAVATAAPAPSAADLLRGLTVLLVDDQPDNLEFLQTFLQDLGATVSAVTSGGAALAEITTHPPNLLLSDIAMPDMDGYTLMRQVRQLEVPSRGVVAIALTAHAGQNVLQQSLEAGFDAHLPKPLDISQLIDTLQALSSRLPARPLTHSTAADKPQ